MSSTLVNAPFALKAVCPRKDLLEAVQVVAHAVSGRTSLPILSHILLESQEGGLRLTASDLELGISTTVPQAVIENPGAITAPARLLSELLSELPEADVSLSADLTHAVRIRCLNSDYKVLGLPSEEYPRLPEVPETLQLTLPQRTLRDMIRKTLFAASQEEARPILTGILMVLKEDRLSLVSTDTHRLAVRTTRVASAQGSNQALVPARAMNEVLRILEDAEGDVQIRFSKNQVLFLTPGGITVVSRLIEGQFPNYERVIPTSCDKKLTLPTQMLQRAVKRASIVARNDANRVVLHTVKDMLVIRAESQQDGTAYEELEVAREGEDIEIAFNAKYLLDILAVTDTEGFRLELTEPLKPGVAKPVPEDENDDADTYLCVLMPMHLV
ncbi:MAG: DNA polymerase III subunit beta [Chthonomonadales bacterium]